MSTLNTSGKPQRRNEKARNRTRGRLICAARNVMGAKGIEATTINEITDAAELSFGSFYNYFSSKEEIARAVFIEDANSLADRLDEESPEGASIAERVGSNIRKSIHHSLNDPVWGWFLIHSAYSFNDLGSTLGARLERDLRIGVEKGEFAKVDYPAIHDSIIGGILYLLRQVLEGNRPASIAESATRYYLRGLGIGAAQADRIVELPLNLGKARPPA